MPDENQTVVQAWTLTTLKAYLEQNLASLSEEVELKFKARDKAQKLQHRIDQEHFKALNNEAARILKATEVTVSRDTWNAEQKSFQDWKNNVERMLQGALPRTEFQTYKDATDKALTLKAGQSQGFDIVRVILTFVAGLVVAGLAVWTTTRGLR